MAEVVLETVFSIGGVGTEDEVQTGAEDEDDGEHVLPFGAVTKEKEKGKLWRLID